MHAHAWTDAARPPPPLNLGSDRPPDMPPRPATDYYAVLGVAQGCSQDDLKRAHRLHALKHHPDKGGDPDAFQAINEAYETLRDPAARRLYDARSHDARSHDARGAPASVPGSLLDMVQGVLGQIAGRQQAQMFETLQNPDLRLSVQVGLEDAWATEEVGVLVRRNRPCGGCAATGSRSGSVSPCPACAGRGVRSYVPFIAHRMNFHVCLDCQGSGRRVAREDACAACLGTCVVEEEEEVRVRIPPDVAQSGRLVLEGRGGCTQSPRLQPAHLVIDVSLNVRPPFSLHSDPASLCTAVRVSLAQALCGGCVSVPHPRGAPLALKLGRGLVVTPGSVFVAQGLGLPSAHHPSGRGSFRVAFLLEFPAELSEGSMALIQQALGYDGEADRLRFHSHLVEALEAPPP